MVKESNIEELKRSVDNLISKYLIDYHFYFEDFTSGKILETGIDKPYPISSCFKIGVVGAYLESLNDYSVLEEILTVEKNDIQPGGGVLNLLECPFPISNRNLLQLILSNSDGTATDLIIAQIGLEKVKQYIYRYTKKTRLAHNLGDLVRATLNEYQKAHSQFPNQNHREIYERIFEEKTLKEDYTNAKDLVELLKGFFDDTSSNVELKKKFWKNGRGYLTWTERFFPADVKFYGKTGSLGYGTAMNDCGIIMRDNIPLCVFALCANKWKVPKHINGHIFGLMGVEILKYFKIDSYQFWDCKIEPIEF